MSGRPAPPSGTLPPREARIAGALVDLELLAAEVCRRYRAEFPDEEERYGEAGDAWCRHDNQWLIAWAALAADGLLEFGEKVAWLGRVLESRDFPVARLGRDLELAAEALAGVTGGDGVAAQLRSGAALVAERGTFLAD